MNASLRRALIQARLREGDVAARLNVDPKTVRRWLAGRVPYPGNRAALAALVRVEEADLWPEAAGPLADRTRPEELIRVFPHRWAIPRDTWARFFSSAQQEIGILAYSALFLAEDAGLLAILTGKAGAGIPVRIALLEIGGDSNTLSKHAPGARDRPGPSVARDDRNWQRSAAARELRRRLRLKWEKWGRSNLKLLVAGLV